MSSIDSSTPVLVPIPVASDPSYSAPAATNIVPGTGLTGTWSGSGGSYFIGVNGLLSQIANLGLNYGLLINAPAGIVTRTVTTGTGLSVTNPTGATGNILIQIVPSTSVQLFKGQVNGVDFGAPRDTINLIGGPGVGITGLDSDNVLNFTITTNTGGSADADAYYWIGTEDSGLPNASNIGLLTPGLLKFSVASDIATPETAIGNTDYMLVNDNMLDIYDLSGSAGALISYVAGHWTAIGSGTTGQVLTTTGVGAIGWSSSSSAINWSLNAAVSNVDMAGYLINNLGTPVAATDACTKGYADSIVGGAPIGAYYLTTRPNAGLTNETDLGALSTGLILSTVTAGASTISTVPVSDFVDVTNAQTIDGEKTFSTNPLFPTAAAVNYVPTCTDAGTGAWSWQPIPGGPSAATLTTADAIPTTLISIPIPINEGITLEGIIQARNAAGTDFTGGKFTAVAGNSAGSASLIGTPFVLVNASSTTDFNARVSGTDLIIEVTGIAATSYIWNAVYTTLIN